MNSADATAILGLVMVGVSSSILVGSALPAVVVGIIMLVIGTAAGA